MSDEIKPEDCVIPVTGDLSNITTLEIRPDVRLVDYREAMALANAEAMVRIGEFMLLSWYDLDRDFESPQHSSECHQDSAIPGYVDYGINHGAKLKIDIEQGRFVFFYLPLDIIE